MSQSVENQGVAKNEEMDRFIAETAKLAQLIAEQKDKPHEPVFIHNECHVIRPANETKQLSDPNATSDDLHLAVTEVAASLCEIAGTYERQLSDEFDNRLAENVDYNAFRTICSNLLSRTTGAIARRGDQVLLVFASYLHLNSVHNVGPETSRYVGQYLSDVGFQSWIQLQGGWQNIGRILSNTDDAPLNPQGTAV